MFSGGIKWNIEPKWVKEQQYRQERHNFMLLACSSVVKQNDCKNKTTLSKYFFFYFMPLTLKTSKNFSKDYFFVQNQFYIKRFNNEIVFKLSKNVKLKIVIDLKIG